MFEPNEELYEKMSVPFETEEEASTALSAFNDRVSELRKELGIAEVIVIAQVYAKREGEIDARRSFGTLGDSIVHVDMIHDISAKITIGVIEGLARRLQENKLSKTEVETETASAER